MDVSYEIAGENSACATIEDSFGVDSIAYFCSTCGEVWGRVVGGNVWQVRSVPCSIHTRKGVFDSSAVGGSLLHPLVSKQYVGRWAWGITVEHLPPSLWRRELELYINHRERKHHEQESTAVLDHNP
jgi:hypothetical protein